MHIIKKREENTHILGNMEAGQDLLIAGTIAQTGTYSAVPYYMEKLKMYFTDSFIQESSVVKRMIPITDSIWEQAGAKGLLEAGEGGIFAALWEVSSVFHKGFFVELQQIPIRQGTIELCEVMGLNPYRLESGECVLLSADNGYDTIRFLEGKGIQAAWIGKIEKGMRCRIWNDGAEGFLERPKEDELHRIICPKTDSIGKGI